MTDPQHVYGWFARSVERYGDQRVALEAGGQSLTYRQLGALAENHAAQILARTGSGPRRVGLLAGRTVSAYVGYLAALRAGATVVPLNPEHPPSRTESIVDAAGLDLVLTDTPGAAVTLGVTELLLEPTTAPGPPPSSPSDLPEPGPDDIAYIIFTSGSTGSPKGVPVLHRNLCAYLTAMAGRYGIGADSRMSAAFDLTFDGSVHDLFVAWAAGATLVVPSAAQLLSPVATVNNLRLTHWFSVPSLISFAERLGTLKPNSMPTLRWSVFGGEALPLTAARAWRTAAPRSAIEVLYGPTELTISCTAYRLPDDPSAWPTTPNGTAPIGHCHPGLEHRILDEEGLPADTGELLVRGAQRFPGYLDPTHDAGRFHPPAAGEGDAGHRDDGDHRVDGDAGDHTDKVAVDHWYRTGDRVTVLDGALVHLGRTDHQIKVRGHRIEPGEVEAVLRDLDGVREAYVLAVPDVHGSPELHAVVSGGACDPQKLFAELTDRLPPYMRPRRISVLESLPLNANGKIDHRALLTELSLSH
ncbi:amino acid adenylation domain-containing protein [Streptomyces sp. NBC_01077]|uniref:amino acid adenylation domain-containing protein n=1 Tax=Streptomyces sp. NBC_01077 TaxID=2903746 RepID=UPI003868F1D4|nr:amino acid adenylation domain-containing protein [Streptomyces sp. NBC_01077]